MRLLYSPLVKRRELTMNQFEQAKDKIMMGARRKSMVMSEEKEDTAYHMTGLFVSLDI